MSGLELEGITMDFGGTRALEDVDMTAQPGEIVGLIGPNGAGKTTLLAIISGFLAPTSGRVSYRGQDITAGPPQRAVEAGIVRTFQATRPIASMTCIDNVKVGAHRRGRSGALGAILTTPRARREERELSAIATEMLGRIGLDELAAAHPGQLSAGQLRLLEIARVLAPGPTLVLLDEPTAGLNHEETRHVEETLVSLNREGLSCLLVEHDVELVFRVCDRVTVLDYGKVIAAGAPSAVRSDPAVIEAYLGGELDTKDAAGV